MSTISSVPSNGSASSSSATIPVPSYTAPASSCPSGAAVDTDQLNDAFGTNNDAASQQQLQKLRANYDNAVKARQSLGQTQQYHSNTRYATPAQIDNADMAATNAQTALDKFKAQHQSAIPKATLATDQQNASYDEQNWLGGNPGLSGLSDDQKKNVFLQSSEGQTWTTKFSADTSAISDAEEKEAAVDPAPAAAATVDPANPDPQADTQSPAVDPSNPDPQADTQPTALQQGAADQQNAYLAQLGAQAKQAKASPTNPSNPDPQADTQPTAAQQGAAAQEQAYLAQLDAQAKQAKATPKPAVKDVVIKQTTRPASIAGKGLSTNGYEYYRQQWKAATGKEPSDGDAYDYASQVVATNHAKYPGDFDLNPGDPIVYPKITIPKEDLPAAVPTTKVQPTSIYS